MSSASRSPAAGDRPAAPVSGEHAPTRFRIATRASRLALWQAEHVAALLRARHPTATVELVRLTTTGDRILDRPLADIGGKGLFTKELELAMLDGRADLAVHSLKDVPMELLDPFELVAVLPREDPRDAFVSNHHVDLDALPEGAVVGTSSVRRAAQIAALRPGLRIEPLRGNLDTRLAKLDEGRYDAIVLACAGLIRLGAQHRIRAVMPVGQMLPAPGQGAIAIECLRGPTGLATALAALDDARTRHCVAAEREVSRRLGGNCRIPLAAHAELPDGADHGPMWLRAELARPDGSVDRAEARADVADDAQAEALGRTVVDRLGGPDPVR